MDIYNAAIGLLLSIFGVLLLAILYRNGNLSKGAKITQNTVGLTGAGVMGIIFGIYFLITSL